MVHLSSCWRDEHYLGVIVYCTAWDHLQSKENLEDTVTSRSSILQCYVLSPLLTVSPGPQTPSVLMMSLMYFNTVSWKM